MLERVKPNLIKPKFGMLTNVVTSVVMLFTVIFIIVNFS
jgi:hypothetical protein